MGCHQSADALSHSRAGCVRPNRTMTYLDRLATRLWDHQYRHYCHQHEYQPRRRDPRAGPPPPSAGAGTEPPRSGRRRTQPAAESVPPDPGACRPPFPPESGPSPSHLALSPIPPPAPAPPPLSPPPPGFVPGLNGSEPAAGTRARDMDPCERARTQGESGAGAVAQGGSGRSVPGQDHPPARLGHDQGTIPEPKPARVALGNGARTVADTPALPAARTGPDVRSP